MLPIIQALLGILPGILQNHGVKNIDLAKIEADLKIKAMELTSEQFQGELGNLNKQADINQTMAQNGKLGWRNALCWGLTVGVLYQIFKAPLIAVILFITYVFGVSSIEVLNVINSIPEPTNVDMVGMLMALAGLYGWRGHEKIQYTKMKQ